VRLNGFELSTPSSRALLRVGLLKVWLSPELPAQAWPSTRRVGAWGEMTTWLRRHRPPPRGNTTRQDHDHLHGRDRHRRPRTTHPLERRRVHVPSPRPDSRRQLGPSSNAGRRPTAATPRRLSCRLGVTDVPVEFAYGLCSPGRHPVLATHSARRFRVWWKCSCQVRGASMWAMVA